MLRLPEKWPGLPEILQAEDISKFLRFSLIFILGLSLLGLAGTLFSQEPGWDTVFWNSLILMSTSALAIWLLQRKRVLPAVYLAVIGNGVWLAFTAWVGAGVQGLTYAALILPVLTAAVFLGRRAGFLAAFAAALYGLILLAASHAGWLVNLERPISETFAWLTHAITFFIAAQLISIALWQVERALKKAHAEINERAHTEAEIRRLNSELEQRIAERTAQLAASEERYRLISTVSSDYMFSTQVQADGMLDLDWVAGAFEKITGYSREEYIAQGGWLSALYPEDLPIDRRDFARLQSNEPVISEVRTIHKNGDLRWVRVYAHPVWDAENQKMIGIRGAVQDITERKQAEEALRKSERLFRTLVEQLPAITYIDRAGKLGNAVYISPQFEGLTGFQPDEGLKGEYDFWIEHVHPEDQERTREQYARCFEKGVPLESEYRFLTKEGRYIWFQDRAIRAVDANGQPEYILGVITDITVHKQTEQRLEQQANHLSTLYQLGQKIVASVDLDEIYRSAQNAVEQLMPTEAFFIALFDEEKKQIDYVFLIDLGQRYPAERVPITASSLTAHVIKTGEPLIIADDADGTSAGFGKSLYGTQRDTRSLIIAPLKLGGKVIGAISAQHYEPNIYNSDHTRLFVTLANQVAAAIENARLVQSLRLQAIALDAAANAIVISDAVGVIQWVNPAFSILTGYSAVEAIGQKTNLLRSGLQDQRFYDDLWSTLAAGKVWHGEIINRRKDGSLYAEEQIITPVRNEKGEIFRFIAIKQDISKRKQAEEREARRREMMEKVIDLGKSVTKITDLRQCLHEIHQSVQKGLGFDRVGLFLYDEKERKLRGTFGTSETGEIEDTSWFTQSIDTYQDWQLALQQPGRMNLISDYGAHYNNPIDHEMHNVKEHVTMVAWVGEKPLALITADNLVTQRKFTAEQLEALQLFAGYAGLAIENADWNAQLERRVAERTTELEAANRELEALAYTIAHDLRIPARAMHGFASILKETQAENLDSEALRRLDRIRESAGQMGQLVDDLLEFMRIGRVALNRRPVDMDALVTRARLDLEKKMADRVINIQILPLPDCEGDPLMLKQVWTNLLGNAIKFTRPREIAEIEIGASEVEGKTQYYIRDNGVGFDMKFTGKLFGAFQRLHHPDEFEGTGMGLAIVQRIIQRHGGSIWAHAEEEKGATFYFTLA